MARISKVCAAAQGICVLAFLWLSISNSIMCAAEPTEAKPAGAHIVQLDVFPEKVVISEQRDRHGVLVLARFSDESTRDVTAESQFTFSSSGIVRIENEQFLPVSDGQTVCTVQFAGKSVDVEVQVEHAHEPEAIKFGKHVLPMLTKAGCNSGKCHGAAAGKDGFRLSLFGYDPAGDYDRLVNELVGRRLNTADPENCLLVNKAVGRVPHTGGARIDAESEDYACLIEWLDRGAQADTQESASLTGITVLPSEVVFARPDELQKVIVLAHYSDGTDRDVTAHTVFLSNNEGAAAINEQSLIQSVAAGEAFVLARFQQFTAGTSCIVRPGTNFEFPQVPSNNYIDELVYRKLNKLHIEPSGLINDEQFLRRASLDLIGQLPTPEQLESFRNNADDNKRTALVESLINRPEFLDLWIMQWAELLQVRTNNGLSSKALTLYDQWLREQVRSGKSIEQIVRLVIPATGGTFDNPSANYFQTETSPQLMAESVAQVFLGTRIQCAQCHNHPFDRWTMDDYYGFAAFFSRIGYKPAKDPRELTIFNLGEGEIQHPVPGRSVHLKFLGAEQLNDVQLEPREALANWLGSDSNIAFARNIANRVWHHFLGTGIVDPIDDFRVSNPASNPELLDALAERLIDYEFDVRKLARDICNSRTYQLSVETNDSNQLDHRNFSHGKVRRMRAEVLLDCLAQVTQSPEALPGLDSEGRAVQIADGMTPNYFLTTFGRSTRQSPCSCEVKTSPTLSQAMHLLNGETTNLKIKSGGLVSRLWAEHGNVTAVARELYRRCYTRDPSTQEIIAINRQAESYDSPEAALEDLFWALLNANEFVFNH